MLNFFTWKFLEIKEKVFGKEHLETAETLISLGVLYYNYRDYAKAEKNYLETITLFEEVLGTDHNFYTSVLKFLDDLYRDWEVKIEIE